MKKLVDHRRATPAPPWRQLGVACLCAAGLGAAHDLARSADRSAGQSSDQSAAHGAPRDIAHCVAGPPIHLADPTRSAMLDNADRDDVQAAILARYPALAADGFAPRQIMLWEPKEAGGRWLFASLLPTPDHPETPCFTATFEANLFAITPALTQKYFFVGKARS